MRTRTVHAEIPHTSPFQSLFAEQLNKLWGLWAGRVDSGSVVQPSNSNKQGVATTIVSRKGVW